jgi:chromosome segregation protein
MSRIQSNRAQVSAAIEALRDQLLADETAVRQRREESAGLEETARGLAARRVADAEQEHTARQGLIGLTVELTRAENAVASLATQDEQALRRVERLNEELEDLKSQHRETLERFEQTASGRTDGEETVQTLRRQADDTKHETRRLEEEVRGVEQTIRRYEDEAAAVESRLRALQGVLREEMGYGREGEEEATSIRSACAGVKESVAEWLRVPPGLERAVEAVLGERLRAWLISEPGEARRAIEFLNQQGLGRGTFVPATPRYDGRGESQAEPEWWPSLNGQAGVVGLAVDLLHVDAESQAIVWCLFDGVVIVNSLDVAIEQWKRRLWAAPNGPALVTIDGEIVDAAGVITGGTAGSSGGLLLRRREVQRLGEAKADIARALQEHRQNLTELLSHTQAGRDAVQRLEDAIRQGELRLLGLMKDESSLRRTVEDLAQRLETVQGERRIQDDERSRYRREMESLREQSAVLKEEQLSRESALTELQQRLRACEGESQAIQGQLSDSRTALAGATAKFEHAQADLSRLRGEQEEQEARIIALNEQLSALAVAMDHSRGEKDRNEARFRELDQQATDIRHDLHAAQQRYEEDLQASQRFDEELAAVRRALGANRERRTAVEVRRAEINTQLAVRQDTLAGTYQLSVEAALAQEPEPAAPAGDEPSIREQLQKLRDRLARMGPINLAAIDEHRELEERHRFLTTQEEDLSKSVTSLKEIIARINRTTKDMFVDTFRELQEKFSEVFARFFPGGRAELVLTEPEPDPEGGQTSEEPGVDIAAQPPGKRLKSITMLSGGEKTLTAMALIFASFLIRPTPFCILDEIDAPLDEENIGRFAAVLCELSQNAQFIVITHNKRTMSIADSLFGVTMEEPGVSKLVSVRLADLQPA